MTKRTERIQDVVQILTATGWSPDGRTREETVRIPTQRSPVFGGCGGELATFGGRVRYRLGERRVTVGPRTTCFYRRPGQGEPIDFVIFRSTQLAEIRECAAIKAQEKEHAKTNP